MYASLSLLRARRGVYLFSSWILNPLQDPSHMFLINTVARVDYFWQFGRKRWLLIHISRYICSRNHINRFSCQYIFAADLKHIRSHIFLILFEIYVVAIHVDGSFILLYYIHQYLPGFVVFHYEFGFETIVRMSRITVLLIWYIFKFSLWIFFTMTSVFVC